MKINEFPNFPNTFPVSLYRLQSQSLKEIRPDDQLSDLEEDMMDNDELNQGLGV